MKKKNRIYPFAIAALLLPVVLLAGCQSAKERLEKEEAYRKIGIDAMDEGDYGAAMDAFNSALAQAKEFGANEADICYYKAAAQSALGSYDDAAETYRLLLEVDSKNSDVYFLRGCVRLKQQEIAKAGEDFAQAIRYAGDDGIYLMIYGSLKGAGYETEASAYMEEALQKNSERTAENDMAKGRLYFLKEQYDKAQEYLSSAVEKGSAKANLYLAKVYEALGDAGKAEACVSAYIEANPKSSVAYNRLGKMAMEQGNYEEAISNFSQGLALEDVTNEQELRSNRIAAYEYSGDFARAGGEMQAYVKDYPNDAAAAREYLFLNKNKSAERTAE